MNKRKAVIISASIVFLSLVAIGLVHLNDLLSSQTWTPQQEQADFEDYYTNIMKNLNAEDKKTEVRSWFERDYNYTELLEWVNDTLVFDKTYTDMERHWRIDPSVIKEIGKGQCGEFAILYVSACLAHGYDSRLVVATDVANLYRDDPHVWAEVKENGNWVHIDPAGVAWNDTYRYERCETGDWGKDIGSTIRIYAFEKGSCEDVTLNYLSKSTEG